jgi:putative oxidoreductase
MDKSVTSNRDAALLIGRVLLGALFIIVAYGKWNGLEGTTGYFTKLGLPAPSILAPLTMVFEAVAGTLLIIGYHTRLVALLIGAFVLAAALAAHTNIADGNQLNHLLKNLAILGGALALYVSGPGIYSVDGSQGHHGR